MASDNYLKNIHSPADIKGMSYAQLNELAAEIRTVLIDTVSVISRPISASWS